MANKIPLKVNYSGASPTALAEFQAGDSIAVANGGTGAITAQDALANLGAAANNHTHNGVYEPADENIQLHLSATDNPHSVTHSQLNDNGTFSHSDIDTHILDESLHFAEEDIDHSSLRNIGTNSHDSIDTHISSTSNPHSTSKSQVGLSNVDDIQQLEKANPSYTGNLTTPLTSGSIPYINSSKRLAEDNSNLFWDATNKRLGLGTSTPSIDIGLSGNAAKIFGMERHTSSDTAGNSLNIQAGGASSGATDKNGGKLSIVPGISTGLGKGTVAIKRNFRDSATGTSDNAQYDALLIPAVINLSNNSVIEIFDISLTAGSITGGKIEFSISVSGGGELQEYTGVVFYCAVNKGGTYTTQINEGATIAKVITSGTLITSWAISTGTDKITITLNAASSLSFPTMRIYYMIHNGSVREISTK